MSPEPGAGPELWLIRHAESEWNLSGRWQGQGNPPLSPRGRAQARALAVSMARSGIERVVSSDLERALQTAGPLAEACRVAVHPDADWRERAIGAWTGLKGEEIEAAWPEACTRLGTGDEGLRPGGGESLVEMRQRIRRALQRLRAEGSRRIAVVTHLGVVRMLLRGLEADHARPHRIAWISALDALRGADAAVDRAASGDLC